MAIDTSGAGSQSCVFSLLHGDSADYLHYITLTPSVSAGQCVLYGMKKGVILLMLRHMYPYVM